MAKIIAVSDISQFKNIDCSLTDDSYWNYDLKDIDEAISNCEYLVYDKKTKRLYETNEYDFLFEFEED